MSTPRFTPEFKEEAVRQSIRVLFGGNGWILILALSLVWSKLGGL